MQVTREEVCNAMNTQRNGISPGIDHYSSHAEVWQRNFFLMVALNMSDVLGALSG